MRQGISVSMANSANVNLGSYSSQEVFEPEDHLCEMLVEEREASHPCPNARAQKHYHSALNRVLSLSSDPWRDVFARRQ